MGRPGGEEAFPWRYGVEEWDEKQWRGVPEGVAMVYLLYINKIITIKNKQKPYQVSISN